jgi:hypothetical protein
MSGIIYLSITLNDINSPIKSHRLVDLKSKTQPLIVYKKCTSLAKTNTGLKGKEGKKRFQAKGA